VNVKVVVIDAHWAMLARSSERWVARRVTGGDASKVAVIPSHAGNAIARKATAKRDVRAERWGSLA